MKPGWLTGTAIDEFLPIYVALARHTDHHGAFSQAEVDAMDISTVAALLRAATDPSVSMQAAAADATSRRMQLAQQGERPRSWADLDGAAS